MEEIHLVSTRLPGPQTASGNLEFDSGNRSHETTLSFTVSAISGTQTKIRFQILRSPGGAVLYSSPNIAALSQWVAHLDTTEQPSLISWVIVGGTPSVTFGIAVYEITPE